MTIQERIERAQRNAGASARVAQEADDEAMGYEAIGLKDKAETCRDRERRHTERAAVWSAAARQLRERQQARRSTAERKATAEALWHGDQAPARNVPQCAVSLAAADGTPHAQAQAQAIEAERNEALGLAAAS
jgi:hypothetical protein